MVDITMQQNTPCLNCPNMNWNTAENIMEALYLFYMYDQILGKIPCSNINAHILPKKTMFSIKMEKKLMVRKNNHKNIFNAKIL